MAITYEKFLSEAQKSGFMDQFSEADLATAKLFPEFGMSLLSLKQDYARAATDQAKALIHSEAEQMRKAYGNYSSRADGSGYYSLLKTPDDYEGANEGRISELLDRIQSYPSFEYDKDRDPSYAAYKKEYLREGERAVADTIGQAAALTGGIPSSAAVTAAQQTGDYYAAQLSDKLPELYENAYARYLGDFNVLNTKLSALQGQDQIDYGRFLDQLDYASDRETLARESAEDRQREAQDVIDAMLAAGASAEYIRTNLPEELAASGYAPAYLDTMAAHYAGKGGGRTF